ncbi:MAG: tetratricopeptide repeat protein [Bacillota bacterium]|nr:tetratricopeptide repeat protein [Bacillota bacterium]
MIIGLEFLSEKLDQIAFFELMKDIEFGNRITLDKNIPLPLVVESVKDKIYESDPSFSQTELIDGIIFLLGLDPKFKHKGYYRELLLKIDDDILEVSAGNILKNIVPGNQIDSLVKIIGLFNLGFESEELLLNIGRLSIDIYRENGVEDFNDLARRIFEYLLKNESTSPLPEYYLGYYYYNKGMYSKAKYLWENSIDKELDEQLKIELVEIFPKLQSRMIYEDGYELILKGRYDEGLEKLLFIKDEFSEWWNVFFFIGLGYRFKEEYQSAIHYLNRALELSGDNVDIMNELGICFTMTSDYDKASEIYRRAIVLDPTKHELICNMGIVYFNKGQLDLARKFFNQAYDLNPEDEITKQWMEHIDKQSS